MPTHAVITQATSEKDWNSLVMTAGCGVSRYRLEKGPVRGSILEDSRRAVATIDWSNANI